MPSNTSQEKQEHNLPPRSPSDASSAPSDSEMGSPQPYEKLLMPEPSPDQHNDIEARKEEIRLFNYVLFHGKSNKDWRIIPAVDVDTFDEPLSPLLNEDSHEATEGEYRA